MDSRLLRSFRKTATHSCLLLLLMSRSVSSAGCQFEPPGAGDCPRANCSVSSGSMLSVSLHLPRNRSLDLYKWNSSTLEWDHIYIFINGTSHPLLRYFQRPFSVSGGDFAVSYVSSQDEGVYRFQDINACLAWLHLTVLDADNWQWYLLIVLLVLVGSAILVWKKKSLCSRG